MYLLSGQCGRGGKEGGELPIVGGIVRPGMALHNPAGGRMAGDVIDSFAKLINVWTKPLQGSQVIRTGFNGHEKLLSLAEGSRALQTLDGRSCYGLYCTSPVEAMMEISRVANLSSEPDIELDGQSLALKGT
jgi:hypothetical protein